MSRIDDILTAQADELAALQEREARAILRLAEDARREMREALTAALADRLDEKTPYTVQHLRTMLAQAEGVVVNLQRRMNAELETAARTAGERALRDLLDVIRANEPEFTDAGGRVEMRVLRRLTVERGLLVHEYSTRLYSSEVMAAIQRDLSIGLLRGFNRKQVVDRIVKSGTGTMAAKEHRAELIARMESNRLYNDMHAAGLEEAAAELDEPGTDDPLLRQMSEFIDARNSPASRAADGIVAALAQPFRIPVAEVERWARLMKKRPGITRQTLIVAGFYECARYPLHFGERGRQVPYRPSWDRGAALAKMRGRQLLGIPRGAIEAARDR